MLHLVVNMGLLSVATSLLAGSWLPFLLIGGFSSGVGSMIALSGMDRESIDDILHKIRRMHNRMEACARQVNKMLHQRSDWRRALAEVLPTLDDRSLRLVVMEVLRAEGYEYVGWASDAIGRGDTIVVRRHFDQTVVRVNAHSKVAMTPNEMVDLVHATYEVRVDRAIAVNFGPMDPDAAKVAQRNNIRVIGCPELVKVMLSHRGRIRAQITAGRATEGCEPEPERHGFGSN